MFESTTTITRWEIITNHQQTTDLIAEWNDETDEMRFGMRRWRLKRKKGKQLWRRQQRENIKTTYHSRWMNVLDKLWFNYLQITKTFIAQQCSSNVQVHCNCSTESWRRRRSNCMRKKRRNWCVKVLLHTSSKWEIKSINHRGVKIYCTTTIMFITSIYWTNS